VYYYTHISFVYMYLYFFVFVVAVIIILALDLLIAFKSKETQNTLQLVDSVKLGNLFCFEFNKLLNPLLLLMMGGAMAMHVGYNFNRPLNGVVSLSAYALVTSNFPQKIHVSNQQTPCLIGHGKLDPVVPFQSGVESIKRTLGKSIKKIKYLTYYELGHEVNEEEIQQVISFALDSNSFFEKDSNAPATAKL
ncbi:hypothetical protein RFI_34825, partial [Reticulomyxa filosa]